MAHTCTYIVLPCKFRVCYIYVCVYILYACIHVYMYAHSTVYIIPYMHVRVYSYINVCMTVCTCISCFIMYIHTCRILVQHHVS